MIKKDLEKEPYRAPQWGLRAIRVERRFLEGSSDFDDGEIIDDDEDY